MMKSVGIVPYDYEVFCSGFHGSKASDHIVRIGYPGGIAVHGYAPDSLDIRVLRDHFFHHVHIRTFCRHGNGYHFNAKMLCDRKMAIITRTGAQKLYFFKLTPWLFKAVQTMNKGLADEVVHQIQAGIATYEDLILGEIENRGKESFCFTYSVKCSIIAAIYSIFRNKVFNIIKKSHGKIKLVTPRFSSGHI